MNTLRIISMISTPEAIETIISGKADVVICDCAPFGEEPTCHILFSYDKEELVTPILPEVVQVSDAAKCIKRVLHYGTDYNTLGVNLGGKPDETWEDWEETEEDYIPNEEEGPWGWTRTEYHNAKFGEEG